jgi:hypothetical protein
MKDGAHTHGHGGGGGTAVLVVLALVLAAAIARPVIHAVTELLDVLVTVVAVLAGLAAAGLVALAVVRVRRWRLESARVVHSVTPAPLRPSLPLSEPRPAIERPQEFHLHLHGVSAEDIAQALAQLPHPSTAAPVPAPDSHPAARKDPQ